MTEQDYKTERKVPDIIDEEDKPFYPSSSKLKDNNMDSNLGKSSSIEAEILWFKYKQEEMYYILH